MKKLALVILLALALPATAAAKGPSKALIVGPGTTIRVSGAEGGSTPFWRLVEETGWFQAAYGPRLPQTPPAGDLGPRYTITWTVPSSNQLHQDVYPYAQPYPVTHMPRGQEIYHAPVKGGWFVGGAKLEKALLRIGVPAKPPPQAAASDSSSSHARAQPGSDSGTATRDIGAIAAGAAIFALALLFLIRAFRKTRRTIAA